MLDHAAKFVQPAGRTLADLDRTVLLS